MSFASGRLTTAEQIVDRMLEQLGMDKNNKKVFSVWLTSRHLRECVCVCVCVCVYMCIQCKYALLTEIVSISDL